MKWTVFEICRKRTVLVHFSGTHPSGQFAVNAPYPRICWKCIVYEKFSERERFQKFVQNEHLRKFVQKLPLRRCTNETVLENISETVLFSKSCLKWVLSEKFSQMYCLGGVETDHFRVFEILSETVNFKEYERSFLDSPKPKHWKICSKLMFFENFSKTHHFKAFIRRDHFAEFIRVGKFWEFLPKYFGNDKF